MDAAVLKLYDERKSFHFVCGLHRMLFFDTMESGCVPRSALWALGVERHELGLPIYCFLVTWTYMSCPLERTLCCCATCVLCVDRPSPHTRTRSWEKSCQARVYMEFCGVHGKLRGCMCTLTATHLKVKWCIVYIWDGIQQCGLVCLSKLALSLFLCVDKASTVFEWIRVTWFLWWTGVAVVIHILTV